MKTVLFAHCETVENHRINSLGRERMITAVAGYARHALADYIIKGAMVFSERTNPIREDRTDMIFTVAALDKDSVMDLVAEKERSKAEGLLVAAGRLEASAKIYRTSYPASGGVASELEGHARTLRAMAEEINEAFKD